MTVYHFNAIRQRVGINLIFGVITIAIATLGPAWS